jgi:anthranilate synthase/aminodeoxychorismate synthase-like glutamine amidotransferase
MSVRPVLVIDNYDSFTFNLVQLCAQHGARVRVVRNDAITCTQIRRLAPAALLISPGPGGPFDAGVSIEAVRRLDGQVPILGVCLGHQAIAAAFGGCITPAPVLMHGKLSRIRHDGSALFSGVPRHFTAARYHSLVVDEPTISGSGLRIAARSRDGAIMALRHAEHLTFGLQFHPESVMTPHGGRLLANFLRMAKAV